MVTNLKESKTIELGNWPLLFDITLDFLWRARNEWVFNQTHIQPRGAEVAIKKSLTKIIQSKCMLGRLIKHRADMNMEASIFWKPPDMGVAKVNCDGAVSHNPRNAACGGVIRDTYGNMIVAFAKHLGDCSSLQAELWAIFYGVQLAKDRGFDRLKVESDSMIAINFLNKDCVTSHVCYPLVRAILNICQDGMLVSWSHTLREANQVVDALSKYGLSMNVQFRIFDVIPSFIALPIMADVSSTHFPCGF